MIFTINDSMKDQINNLIVDENGNLIEGILPNNANAYLTCAEANDEEIMALLVRIRVLQDRNELLHDAVRNYVRALEYKKENPDQHFADENLREADISVRAALKINLHKYRVADME